MNHKERWHRAAHCMQAGVKMDKAGARADGEHVQSRIGINVALRDHGSLVALLVSKGVITDDEYFEAIADGMEQEVREYEALLSRFGTKVRLVGRLGSIHDEDKTS